jgi:ribosome-binding protein aMBF1 (putative translation factor)
MGSNVAHAVAPAHRVNAEIRPRMAKADLRNPEVIDLRPLVGTVIQRAMALLGWTLDRLAREIDRDPRQIARWIAGTERPQFDVLWAVEQLRQPLVLAFAELAGSAVEIETVVRVRRIA